MNDKYDYQCPDCGKILKFGDKFCKECGCKIDWEDDEKNKEQNSINDKNENFRDIKEVDLEGKTKKKSKKDIIKKKKTKPIKKIICAIICIALVIAIISTVYYIINQVNKPEDDIYSSAGNETSISNRKISEEEFEKIRLAKEKEAKEIWGYENEIHTQSGKIVVVLDEFVVMENHTYRFLKIGDACSFYEVNFSRIGDKVNISYNYENTISFDGLIKSDTMILYNNDGTTIYGEYPKISK